MIHIKKKKKRNYLLEDLFKKTSSNMPILTMEEIAGLLVHDFIKNISNLGFLHI